MSVASSKILYICIIVIVLGLANGVTKSRKHSLRYAIIMVIILALIAGLRGSSVGIDTLTYKMLFELNDGRVLYAYGVSEPVFIYLSSAIMTISGHTWTVFLFWAIVTNGLIIFRLYELRDRLSFVMSLAVYMLIYYFLTFNIMRQMVAVGIIFFAARWLEGKQQLYKFLVAALIAFLIHNSALISLVYIPISIICRHRQLSKAKELILVCCMLTAPIVWYVGYIFAFSRYQYVLQANIQRAEVGLVVPLKILTFICALIFAGKQLKRTENGIGEYKIYLLAYSIGLAGFLFSYF